ncbi:hypothetical protein [Nostoc sp. T09]|nr:hypothetical protein [Nostoc sp. T09]
MDKFIVLLFVCKADTVRKASPPVYLVRQGVNQPVEMFETLVER